MQRRKILERRIAIYLKETGYIEKFKEYRKGYNSNSKAAGALLKSHYDSLDKREIENLNRLFDEMTLEQRLNPNRYYR